MLSILSAIEVDIIILLVVFGSIWLLVIHCVGNRLIPFRQLSFHGSSRAAGLPYNPITAAAGTSLNTSSATREKQHKSETTRYDRSPQQWDRVLNDEEKKKIGATWLKKNSLDYWRHERMRKCIIPFVRENPNASWLTVGDGRYGTDANYLESLGAKSVHASDISDTLLRLGGKGGFISEYSAQNAESLAFPDNHFDYVYCKEAFHHFPRPLIALHEMFRVARKAVIFTEPRDAVIHFSLLKSWQGRY